ncbi:SAYSvFN domain-containing protein 1 isoform X1 [Macaca nemestrina]|uniref:SAYSvFN domain-containing protein 1 isoform X1 n=1 Tax=Macaca nemestrina TaxID=9545 RepID=UPI0039B8314B
MDGSHCGLHLGRALTTMMPLSPPGPPSDRQCCCIFSVVIDEEVSTSSFPLPDFAWRKAVSRNNSVTSFFHIRTKMLVTFKNSYRSLLLPSPAISQEAPQPQGSTSQPPWNIAIPLPSCWDQSFLTNITFLKVLLWLVLLGLFVELEFGLAYFVLSLFYWMYVGTRGPEEKKEGEKSAYSVFNPGCEAIQGTLTAEQLERELQLRPLAGR